MRIISTLLPAILAGTATMLLSIPMVSANMKYLVSIRTRLDRLVNIDELSANQYTYIVNNIASNELLDAEMKDHSIHISVPRISDEIADYFCDWLDQEEINGDMMKDTANLIRNLFELGAAPSRPEDIPLSRINGAAQGSYKNNGIVNFVARINFSPPIGGRYNGIWGFTKGSREYALQCNSIGLNIVDVTTTSLVLIQTIPMPGGTTWRDVATNGNYAYVAAQGGSGPVAWVVNLSQLSGASAQGPNSDPITGSNIKNIGNQGWGHTLNVWNDLLFLNGAGGSTYGCRIFDLRPDPMSPELITTYTGGDCHDSYGQRIGQQDVLFSADGYTGSYRILDISNIRTSTQIPKIGETNFVSGAYAHQNVVSDDGKTLFVFDENNEFDIGVYDISDLSTPDLIRTLQWSGEQSEGNAIVHNGLILGNYLVVAYYKAGLRVFDISNTSNIQEVGKYETFRDPNGDGIFDENSLSGFDGAWNVAKLSSGKILISDTVSGTFVVTLNGNPGPPTPAPQTSTLVPTPAVVSSFEPTPPNSSLDPTPSSSAAPTSVPIPPTTAPIRAPTPTIAPVTPTLQPASEPTRQPASEPTRQPAGEPTRQPTSKPTRQPTSEPTRQPTSEPTRQPTSEPTREPTRQPTSEPTRQPTSEPTRQPTSMPTSSPVRTPTKVGDPECKPNEQFLRVNVKTDADSDETKVVVARRNKKGKFKRKIILGKKLEESKINSFSGCVNIQAFCYRLKITDKGRNGITNGFIKMFVEDNDIYFNKFKNGNKRMKKFGFCPKQNN